MAKNKKTVQTDSKTDNPDFNTNHNQYNESLFDLFGLGSSFKLAHLPLLTYNDVFGAVALEGSSGTGKTTLISRLGQLIKANDGGDYLVCSADKIKYEDFIGIPIPNMESKSLEILPMPNAIATKTTVLIDEANRAGYDSQEKFLQLLSTRKIDGTQTSCKYLYLAMNPVLSEDEAYEGVQPLDKAYGERVQALLAMPRFYDMDKTHQIKIMTSCFDQATWAPSENLIKLHNEFITEAKNHYNELKTNTIEQLSEYLHIVSSVLYSESKKSIKLEARRMQFILVNILGNHALNLTYNKESSLTNSVLEALAVSFPQRLWGEDSIKTSQIQAAHSQAAHVLKPVTKVTKVLDSYHSIKSLMSGLKSDIQSKRSAYSDIEERSKRVNQMIPDITQDPIDHFIFAFSMIKASEQSKNSNNPLIKANEFERLNRIVDNLKNHAEYKRAKTLAEKSTKKHILPPIPEWIDVDLNPSDKAVFVNSYNDEISWYVNALVGHLKENNIYDDLSFSYTPILEKFNTFRGLFISCIQGVN